MSDNSVKETAEAIERTKRLLDDAALFHLASIPLPVKVARVLVALAEHGLRDARTSIDHPSGC